MDITVIYGRFKLSVTTKKYSRYRMLASLPQNLTHRQHSKCSGQYLCKTVTTAHWKTRSLECSKCLEMSEGFRHFLVLISLCKVGQFHLNATVKTDFLSESVIIIELLSFSSKTTEVGESGASL